MHIDACKTMCKNVEPCYFTYTSNFGCRVYTACDEPETSLSADVIGHVDDWVTCERFFGNYTNQTVALYNEKYDRYLLVDDDGKLGVAVSSINITDIAPAMRFTIAETSNLYALNQLTLVPGGNLTAD